VAAPFRALRRALHHLRLRLFPVRDPWLRLPYEAPLALYGDGAKRDFDWVFEGDSTAVINTLDELMQWLAECTYDSDARLFQEADFWQHPRTFEHLRRGDCEDYALWAWRKLLEIGIDADLVIGRRVPPGTENSRHAWIVFRGGEGEFVFEPVACRDRSVAVRPLAAARAEYIPEFGVDRNRQRFFFAGYAFFLQNPHLGRAQGPASDRRRGVLSAAPAEPGSS